MVNVVVNHFYINLARDLDREFQPEMVDHFRLELPIKITSNLDKDDYIN